MTNNNSRDDILLDLARLEWCWSPAPTWAAFPQTDPSKEASSASIASLFEQAEIELLSLLA